MTYDAGMLLHPDRSARFALPLFVLGLSACTRETPTLPRNPCEAELPPRTRLLAQESPPVGAAPTMEALGLALDPHGANETVELVEAFEVEQGERFSFAALSSTESGVSREQHLAFPGPHGWIASAPFGAAMEDRSGSSYAEVVDGYLGHLVADGAKVPVLLVRLVRGESIAAGCGPREELAGTYYRFCTIGETLDCFAEVVGETRPYDRDDLLPSAAEAMGQCDDALESDDPPPDSVPVDHAPAIELGFADGETLQISGEGVPTTRFTLTGLQAKARRCPGASPLP